MPNQPPPDAYSAKPGRSRLKAWTRLTHIHDARFGAERFNPTLADRHWGGGCFDATEEELHDPVLKPPDDNWLDRDPGLSYVRKLLARYNVTLAR